MLPNNQNYEGASETKSRLDTVPRMDHGYLFKITHFNTATPITLEPSVDIKNFDELTNHIDQKHTFWCIPCIKKFTYEETIKDHNLATHHYSNVFEPPKNHILACPHCDRKFKIHKTRQHSLVSRRCQDNFGPIIDLEKHEYSCFIRNKRFEEENLLKTHVNDKHHFPLPIQYNRVRTESLNQDISRDKIIECASCNISFDSKRSLKNLPFLVTLQNIKMKAMKNS